MAQGQNASSNGRHRDFWSKRPYSGYPREEKHGDKWVKRMTHKVERQQGKKEVESQQRG